MVEKYHPQKYWTEVAKRIRQRENGKNVIAGDDEPYYRYKRKRFLDLFHSIDFSNKSVLEIGCGPGGNLLEVLAKKPAKLIGVDISEEMVSLAKNKLPQEVKIIKIDGTKLPFDDHFFDIVFTATVLQHNTDEAMLRKLMKEISRVSSDKVYIFERIEQKIKGDDLCLGRPISYYSSIMEENGFLLTSQEHINIRVSYYVSGIIRKMLNPGTRKEGEPLNRLSIGLQKLTLPVTKLMDNVFKSGNDIARLEFQRRKIDASNP